MQLYACEPIKSCSISTYTNTAWYRPFMHQKPYICDKRVGSAGMSCGKAIFHVRIKQLTKNFRKRHFTASGDQIQLLWAILKLSSFWTFLAKNNFSIDFLKLFSKFFSRKARKSRKFFHEKNSSFLKKISKSSNFLLEAVITPLLNSYQRNFDKNKNNGKYSKN